MTDDPDHLDPDNQEVTFRAIRAEQPIGDIYIASIPHDILGRISWFDVRRVLQEERDIERYLGIQRPLSPHRVAELQKYVHFRDATFPTGIIIAVDSDYAEYDEAIGLFRLRNYREGDSKPSARIRQLARVIDGQHRIAGLYAYEGETFELPVVVFVGSDISDQAYVFATVNLEQTKVSKSLVYDLFSLARTRSPQRTGHEIAVALDSDSDSPFYKKIKRLGIATPGRRGELITQATFVESLLRYISDDAKSDRDRLLRGQALEPVSGKEGKRLIFRNMFIEKRDVDIGRVVNGYFSAIRDRWPKGWQSQEKGIVLNKTNGFRAFMRVLGPLYNRVALPGNVPGSDKFLGELRRIEKDWTEFNTDIYLPGTSGESEMRRDLLRWLDLED